MSERMTDVLVFRAVYGYMCAEWCRDDSMAEFDRLVAHIRAEAWDEGCEAFEAAHRWDRIEPWQHLTANPYRDDGQ